MAHIRYCQQCQRYSIFETCPICTNKTIIKHPARYSPQDRYGQYRRALKKMGEKKSYANGNG